MMVRAHIYVHGLVQGVYFRHYTKNTADILGLKGWVNNLADGTVEILCEGPREKVLAMIDWCKEGPAAARVEGTDVLWEGYTGEIKSFDVRY
jgi:acylphosphatase